MFCIYCGTKLKDADKFCFSCGKSTNKEPIPDNSIIKQEELVYKKSAFKNIKGTATLYNDRFEWRDGKGIDIDIKISKITKANHNTFFGELVIHLNDGQKYEFRTSHQYQPYPGSEIVNNNILSDWLAAIYKLLK